MNGFLETLLVQPVNSIADSFHLSSFLNYFQFDCVSLCWFGGKLNETQVKSLQKSHIEIWHLLQKRDTSDDRSSNTIGISTLKNIG